MNNILTKAMCYSAGGYLKQSDYTDTASVVCYLGLILYRQITLKANNSF